MVIRNWLSPFKFVIPNLGGKFSALPSRSTSRLLSGRRGSKRRRTSRAKNFHVTEAMEVRLLLSATTDTSPVGSTMPDITAAMGAYQFDTSVAYTQPDYNAFVQNSPLATGSNFASDPLAMQMSQNAAMMQAAQQQAASATDVDAISEIPSSGSPPSEIIDAGILTQQIQAATGDSSTLPDYVTQLTSGTSSAPTPSPPGYSSQTQASGNLSSGPTATTSNGTTSSSTAPTNTAQSIPSDPRLNWTPLQAPDGVSFNDSDFVGYGYLHDPFAVTPDGTGTFSNQQTRVASLPPESIDSAPATVERNRTTTTTFRTQQDYVSPEEWTVTYTLTNRFDDDEQPDDSDEAESQVNRGYLTTLVLTITNGTKVTKTFTVSDSFRYGDGKIPGEEQGDDPWTIPVSWMDRAEQSVNRVDSETSSSTQSQDSSELTHGSGFFVAAGYSATFTNTTEKVTMDDGAAATRTTNSFSWSSDFSLRIGSSYNSSQAGSSSTGSVTNTDQASSNSPGNPSVSSYSGADSSSSNGVTANNNGSTVTTSDPYPGFQPVAKGHYQAFATGSVAAAFSYAKTVPNNPLNFLSSTFSASAAFAVSALAGSNSDSSVKGDLDQSSGSVGDNTDEHLRIHVDNSDKASASAGFSFWFGVSVGTDSSLPGSEGAGSTVNTNGLGGNAIDLVSQTATPAAIPPATNIDASNTPSRSSKPGRQSASELIQKNPKGIQLALSTSASSNVSEDFSFSEKTRPPYGYILNSDSDKKKSTSDIHFALALGTEKTDLEFGKSKGSSTDVDIVFDEYGHHEVSGAPYHTAQFTDTYSEHTIYNDNFQFSLNSDTPVTNTVFLKESIDGSSRDYRSGEMGTAIVLKTEQYFNTTDRDDAPTGIISLDDTAEDKTPIYLYVESFTGADGTVEYVHIEETPAYPIGWFDGEGGLVNPDGNTTNTPQQSAADLSATLTADDNAQILGFRDTNSFTDDSEAAPDESQLSDGASTQHDSNDLRPISVLPIIGIYSDGSHAWVEFPITVGVPVGQQGPPTPYIVKLEIFGPGWRKDAAIPALVGVPALATLSVKTGWVLPSKVLHSRFEDGNAASFDRIKEYIDTYTKKGFTTLLDEALEAKTRKANSACQGFFENYQLPTSTCTTFAAYAAMQFTGRQLFRKGISHPNELRHPWTFVDSAATLLPLLEGPVWILRRLF